MRRLNSFCCSMMLLSAPALAGPGDDPFPVASPGSQGVSAESLIRLFECVQGYFEEGSIVGAELLVIKNRRTLLHETVGWKDREQQQPMEPHTLFNIRSMTKPITGTAAQLLLEEELLALEDPVADYLDAFRNERSERITVEQLLTHRAGVPMSLLTKFEDLLSLQQVAAMVGERGPDNPPGSTFLYSDAGSDSLGALIEALAEQPLAEFVGERILEPLGMQDSVALFPADGTGTERVGSTYLGGPGAWNRYWVTGGVPLYPFAMGSQSLFSTPRDYARFLDCWMNGGRIKGGRLLSDGAVTRGLKPVSAMTYPTGFVDVNVWYAQMWTLWLEQGSDPDRAKVIAFGHGGSDGTWAWAFPEHDLMVMYFTQSRGQGTGISLEAEIDRYLLRGATEAPTEAADRFAPFLGTYFDGPACFTVVSRSGRLILRLPNRIDMGLEEPDEQGLRHFVADRRSAVAFVEDDDGQVTSLKLHQDDDVIDIPRKEPEPEVLLSKAQASEYLGLYHDPQADVIVEIVLQDGRLAIKSPAFPAALELITPEGDLPWRLRLNPSVSVTFERDASGTVTSYLAHVPGKGSFERPRVDGP